MPLFRRKSSLKKEQAKLKTDGTKTEAQPLVHAQAEGQKRRPQIGQGWAESLFYEQGWSIDSSDIKQGFQPLTPPTSPPYSSTSVSSMSRSFSQPQALPYHRPWNRHLASYQAEHHSQEQHTSRDASTSSPTRAGGVSQPSISMSQSKSMPIPGYFNSNVTDFRVSPSKIPSPTPAQRKQTIDTARRASIKKAKAPSEFNILVMGARNTGKTSWIRTLLSTLDLGHCDEETRTAAGQFGVSASSSHPSRRTDPATPLSTKSIDCLSGIELDLGSLGSMSRPQSLASARGSIFSSGTSIAATRRLHFAICDTPGLDFDFEDEFETQRKVSKIVKYAESKLNKTLAEEGKIQRRNKSDDYVHLIVYFIDPRHLVERSECRRKGVRQNRGGNAVSAGRGRSTSESHAQGKAANVKSQDPASQWHGDVGEGFEDQPSTEGLSPFELAIISRMSKYANVLPIIAKADTLTMSQLYDVRQAVRKSLKEAKIDLGTFDITDSHNQKQSSLDEMVETMMANQDRQSVPEVNSKKEVKVIRVRSRRSFSSTGRVPSSIGHGGESEVDHTNSLSLETTDPLFPGGSEAEADPEAAEKAHDELLAKIPLSIFVPEPIEAHHREKSLRRSETAQDQDVFGLQPGVPPVPPLPRLDSSDFVPKGRDETGRATSPVPTRSRPLPAASTLSSRYKRDYRWGSANVLDPDQCDFNLLRSTILGTHLGALKESTSLRYEQYRSRKLELKQQLTQGIDPPV